MLKNKLKKSIYECVSKYLISKYMTFTQLFLLNLFIKSFFIQASDDRNKSTNKIDLIK